MKAVYSELDAQELLHLALKATEDNKFDESIKFLKQAIELDPGSFHIFSFAL